jgi:UDP-N-acetylmuramoyl-tripeptide--D-alanyl-D-alanine ligase
MNINALYNLYKQHPVVCTDTRSILPDCLFFAFSGAHFDGNQFALEALAKGAAYAIVSDPAIHHDRVIHVNNTVDTLQSLARHHRHQFEIPFLAITGTNGKTTTKELVSRVLSTQYIVHSTSGNFNNHIGVPLTLLNMQTDTQIAVIEMGANHIGEIDMLCRIAEPTHGLITNIGYAHLEGFGSFEGVIRAKSELFQYVDAHHGMAFINADDPSLNKFIGRLNQFQSYGLKDDSHADVHFKFEPSPTGSGFTIIDRKSDFQITSSLFGPYNASNCLAALCVGRHFKVPPELIRDAISTFSSKSNRSEIVRFNNCTIVKDAYNANPSSMELAIKAFSEQYPEGWLIIGDMKELGPESPRLHQRILDQIQLCNFPEVYFVGEEFIKAGKLLRQNHRFHFFPTIEDVKQQWNWEECKGKAVLMKGSRSLHLERLLET